MSQFMPRPPSEAGGNSSTRFYELELNSGFKNGLIRVQNYNHSPILGLCKKQGLISRIQYVVNIPKDYIAGTNVLVRVFWSVPVVLDPTQQISWLATYKFDQVGSEIYTPLYTQALQSINGAQTIVDTDTMLVIPGAQIVPGSIFTLGIERGFPDDTYDSMVRVHSVRIEYVSNL